jgi:epoxyqueuosine reductase
VGDWIFGCDICQEVCPWNGDVAETDDEAFAPPSPRRALTLGSLLGLGEEDYRTLFRGSPLKRARLEGLRRNVALAVAGGAGNAGLTPSPEKT